MRIAAATAAGRSSRFGSDKLTADLGGKPVLLRTLEALRASPAEKIVCVVSAERPARRAIAEAAGADVLELRDGSGGLSASIAAAAERAEACGASRLLIALGDAPLTPPEHYAALFEAARDAPSFTAAGGRRQAPAAFPASHFAALRELGGDAGARDLIAAAPSANAVALDEAATFDIDAPEDLARARAALARLAAGS